MPTLDTRLSLEQTIRFRDDDPEMFGMQVGDGPGDKAYLRGLRDHLSNSVELVAGLFPELARLIGQVQHDILPGEDIHAFVSGDPQPQAWCIGGNEEHTMILGVTSGLVQLLEADELKFVIGHEIGHHVMGHHRHAAPDEDGVDGINFRSLQRMAEISADRVGFLACARPDAGPRAILKTVSGLSGQHLRFDSDAFDQQFAKLKDLASKRQGSGSGSHDAWSTHPLFTVRCRALQLFGKSQPFHDITGRRQAAELTREQLEDSIAGDLYDSTGYHPMAEIEHAVRVNLIWMVLRLFIEDGRFTKGEQAFLRDNFEAELADKAIDFVRQHGPIAVCRKYEEALDNLASMSEAARNSACGVVRRVASVAGGDESVRLKLLGEMHKHLACKARVRIQPWADEHSLGGLLDLNFDQLSSPSTRA